jgi:hypothetical protein
MTLTSDILSGKYDNDLNTIAEAVRQRETLTRKAAAAVTMASIEPGDTVVLKDISPKYLIGAKAKVIRKRQTRLECELLKDHGRYRAGFPVGIPVACVEKDGD